MSTWQPSPQYRGMPWNNYLQTSEGREYQAYNRRWEEYQLRHSPMGGGGQGQAPSWPSNSGSGQGQPGAPSPAAPQGDGMRVRMGSGQRNNPNRRQPQIFGGETPAFHPGQAQPQQSPWSTSTPYGQMPQSPAGQQGNAAGGNQTPMGQPPSVMPEPGLRPLPGSPAERHFGGQPGNRPPPYGQQQPPAPRQPDYGKIGDWSDADIAAANESHFSGGQQPFHPVRYSRDASGNVVMTPSMFGMPPIVYRPSASPPAPSMPPAGQQGNAAGGNRPPAWQPPAVMPEPGLRQLATQGPNGEPRGLPRPRHSPNDTLASGSGSLFAVSIDGRGGQPADRPPSLYGPDPMTVSPSGHPMHILMHNPQQQPASRPPPFQSTTQNFDGTQSQMPNFQQRDAFISQINRQLGQMQQQSWQQPGMGAPQFNFPQMWGQAGQMAQQGWQNPFAAPRRPPAQGDVIPGARSPASSGGYFY